ncbi:pilus assembly protein [Arsukibacterium sp. UBA3155]|uniref:pilus assembly protein n=1 Tax=Arsukibacterium sp. UBA3155 TaxID=1946058 RepID=UPI0025B8E750|nr:PilC/PilY family type IV pilus protein [Arsukibacterium sp. UBA3155]|tara:strand:+ start:66771 stop:70181 length:3411 start_codon:yes stop_codon:yes gene_type:complete
MKLLRSKMLPVKCAFLASMLFGSAVAHAAIEISQTPLQTGSSVPPNIMFIIDDSGSMQFELLPDEAILESARYIFPRADGIYEAGDYNNRVPTVQDGQPYNAFSRSPQMNKSYYDPSVTYKTWVNADGTAMPNANPSCAWHNPVRTGSCPSSAVNSRARNLTVTNSNYNDSRWVRCTSSTGGCTTESDESVRNFWPASYFNHNGGSNWVWGNYTKVEIKPTTAVYSGHGRTSRTDCTAGVCTYAQEIQNFANWYTYHRSRILTSRAGIGRAFVGQSEKMRVGFGALNKSSSSVDGVNTSVIVRGVREFKEGAKATFFSDLYNRAMPAAGTPLLSALNAAGEYYSRDDSKGPWGVNPGSGTEAPVDHISCRQSFTILMTDGYWSDSDDISVGNQDGTAGTTILRPVGDTGGNYTYTPVAPFSDSRNKTLADIAMKFWKADLRTDLDNRVPTSTINPAFWQHMVTFGIGLGVVGNIEPDDAFAAINSGATINWLSPSSNPAKIDDLLHASVNGRGGFFTADKPDEFASKLERTLTAIIDRVASASNLAGTTTSMQADNFVYQGSFNSGEWSGSLKSFNIDDVNTPIWESNFPAWDSRKILFGKTSGIAADFTPTNVTADGNALSGKINLINYLRGDQSLEVGDSAQFRRRVSLLGDIANSSPLYLAAPVNRNYQRYNWDGASSYRSFLISNAARAPMVYVGANDGMLHAFNGSNGTEVMAYVPRQILTEDADLESYADPEYQHKYYVDGSSVVFDAYIGSAWRSILLGSLGRGGDSLFAIDVTDPSALTSATAAGKVLWDKRYPELGVTTNKPVIARLNNGKWVAVAGYGYNNSTNKAGLLIIDLANGEVLKKLETTSGSPNGLGQVEGWDATGDGNTDWFFGGDLLGNIWKFDLSSTNPSEWNVAYSGQPLFAAKDAVGDAQAITGGLSLSAQPETGHLWVFFGTGKMLSSEDPLLSDPNSWYGIRDGIVINGRADLKQRDIVSQADNARVIEPGAPYDMLSMRGWYIDLGDARERIVNRPQLVGNSLVINTITPGDNDCNPQGSGWVMSVSPYTGSRLSYLFFDRNNDGVVDSEDGLTVDDVVVPVTGVRFDGMPSEPVFFEDKMVVGLADTRIANLTVAPGVLRGRVSWRELTNQ